MGYRFGTGLVALQNDADTGHVIDLDGDGLLDVVVLEAQLPYPNGDEGEASGVSWLDGRDGWRTKHPIIPTMTYDNLEGLIVADVDGDGINEIVVADQEGHRMWVIKPPGGDYFAPAPWPSILLPGTAANIYRYPHDTTVFTWPGRTRPTVVFACEGDNAGEGGVFSADCDGDALTPASWTLRTLWLKEGPWGICDRLGDFSGSGRGDMLISLPNSGRNPATVPGAAILNQPADPTSVPWPVTILEDEPGIWWGFADFGEFSGDGNGLDIINFDSFHVYGPGYYRFSTGFTERVPLPDIPYSGGAETGSKIIRMPGRPGGRDDILYVVGQDIARVLSWHGTRWVSYGLFKTGHHPADNRIQVIDIGGGQHMAVIFDSGGNKVRVAQPYAPTA